MSWFCLRIFYALVLLQIYVYVHKPGWAANRNWLLPTAFSIRVALVFWSVDEMVFSRPEKHFRQFDPIIAIRAPQQRLHLVSTDPIWWSFIQFHRKSLTDPHRHVTVEKGHEITEVPTALRDPVLVRAPVFHRVPSIIL